MPACSATAVNVTGCPFAVGPTHACSGARGVVAPLRELGVPICFADPPAVLRVFGELLGVGFLGGEHGQVAGVGAEVRAVLADVGVGAGTLGGSAEAESACQPGFDRRSVFPLASAGDVGEWQACAAGGQRPEFSFREGEGAFVFSADGGVE